MEEAERQIWERVRGFPGEPLGGQPLQALILEAEETAGAYRQLGEALPKHRERLGRLQRNAQENLALLKGMAVLSGGEYRQSPRPRATGEPAARLLKKCWYRSRREWMEYTARSAEPEFGAVFQEMAARQARQCAGILQLLGEIRQK